MAFFAKGLNKHVVAAGIMDLRLAVLSRGPRLYSTRRLVEEARARGVDVSVIDPMQFSLFVSEDNIDILHQGKPFNYDAVIPRIGHSITSHGVAVLRHLEQLGIWSANSSSGIIQSRDKLHSGQILARNKIPTPATAYVRDMKDVERAIDSVGGLPVVIKVTQGTQGNGVFLRHTLHEARNLVQGLLMTGKAILVQQYISESHGKDIRAFVIGDKVVACMRRRARGREFRSNFHLNGTVESVEISDEYREVACRAARVLGLNVAGVDLLEGVNGPLVLEVNSSPGLEGIEKASGQNVAGAIIDFVSNDHNFSDVNMDLMLNTVPGMGALSIHMKNHPYLVGCTISELYGSRKPTVMALSRDGELIWNPEVDSQLRFSDVIICYGKLQDLKLNLRQKLGPRTTNYESSRDEVDA
ncbi:MAG: 30S ribosomal protein S6--L-glutamate ligase [Zetaproteobacteria bacterium]|nr:30S ribosomal protein S6--L-glutamate ligase [Pseudobdellovibrionaceae bacterium]